MVSYAASLIRMLHDKHILTFYLRMTIESIILISSIYLGGIIIFTIDYLSSSLQALDVRLSRRKACEVCVLVRWVKGDKLCLLEIIMGYGMV